ncbi:MAG: hypothetical protein HC933_02840 [Pleurocapsa sp. SU_196_0]|nr:hypothetical protein [Pleurocapsa sp. SU_196_0]
MRRHLGWMLALVAAVIAVGSAQTGALTGKKVVLAGSIQKALGSKEWDPSGDITRMTETASGVFEFTAAFPKGTYEYKVAVGGTWDENYGKNGEKNGGNIPLEVGADGTIVKFVFTYDKKEILDSINHAAQVTAPSSVPVASTAAPAVSAAPAQPDGTTRLTLHYQRARGDYDGWNLWVWGAAPQGTDGKSYPFTASDDFGKVAVLDVPGVHTKLGFIVRLGDWQAKDGDTDRFIDVKDGKAEVWVLQGQKEFFTSKADVDAYLAKAAPPRGEPAFLESADTIRAWLPKATDPSSLTGKVRVTLDGKAIAVKAITAGGPVVGGGFERYHRSNEVVLAGTIQGRSGNGLEPERRHHPHD